MSGGHHTQRQLARALPLGERPVVSGPGEPEHVDTEAATAPKPCWITLTDPTPGHVLAWIPSTNGWHAIVTIDLPATAVTPR